MRGSGIRRTDRGPRCQQMPEWRLVRKKPVVVQVREVRPGETGMESLEGFQPCSPKTHVVIKGIVGEEYPVRRDIFASTYEYVDEES